MEMCALLWNIMTWYHHYQITLRARHIPGCKNVMSDFQSSPVSRMVNASTDVQQIYQSGSLLCRSICHSSEPQSSIIRISSKVQHAWDIDALNINWSGLTAYAYPPMALLHRAIHVRQYNCLIIVMTPGWPGMPSFWDLEQLSTEIPLQLPVSFTAIHNMSSPTPGV